MEEKNEIGNIFKSRLISFKHAFNGLKILFSEECNARIHLIVSVLVIVLGFLFNISPTEWLIICLLIALVLSLEIINTAIENICDFISPEWNDIIKKVKDLSAAAVFLAAVAAIICGTIIFIPKLCDFIAHI